MLYVERDQTEKIIAIRLSPNDNTSEQKSVLDEELIEFLTAGGSEPLIKVLSLSDIGIIRIVEDLIDLLIKKNLLLFTELPKEAQEKIMERKQVRQKLDNNHLLVDDIL